MFRRDKESKLDNEGLRRMREAIRQRLEQEEIAATDEDEASGDTYHAAAQPAANDDFDEVAPFNPDAVTTYGGGNNANSYQYLTAGREDRTLPAFETSGRQERTLPAFETSGRQERTLPAFEAPVVPTRTETPAWTPTEPAAPAEPSRATMTTVAGDSGWRGVLRSEANIQIDGTFDGEIQTEQGLIVAADAKVEATVHAATITVAGQLNGQINCRERLEILPTGRVSGQIVAGKFIVHEGAYLGGQVRMVGADDAEQGARPMLQRVR